MIAALWTIGGRRERRALIGYLIVLAAFVLLAAVPLILLAPVLAAVAAGEAARAVSLLVALGLAGVGAALCGLVATVVGQRVGSAFILRMHTLIGERMARLPLGWFDVERTGALSETVTRGVTFAANAPDMMLRPLLQALVTPAIAGIGLLFIDVRAGVCVLGSVLVVGVAYAWAQRATELLDVRSERHVEDGSARMIEFVTAQPAVRLAGPGSVAETHVRDAIERQHVDAAALLRMRGRGMTVYSSACYLGLLASMAIAAVGLLDGSMPATTFVAVLTVDILIVWLGLQYLPFGEGLQIARRALRDVRALWRAPLLPEPQVPGHPDGAEVVFDRVAFGYPATGRTVLDGVSFTAPAGAMTAIVGPSGSGKTTITRLIARFHDVESGGIRIGGVDVRDLGTDGVMSQVSMVFQHVHLFEATLRENIRLGRPDADDDEVLRAASLAGVDEIAQRLPAGFDTPIGEGGGTLSGGERQRVSIARALLKSAPVVLLDEATAALDIDSEAHVQRALRAMAGETTRIVVAHRLQTIREADHIVVLDGRGGVEATGTHDELFDVQPDVHAVLDETIRDGVVAARLPGARARRLTAPDPALLGARSIESDAETRTEEVGWMRSNRR